MTPVITDPERFDVSLPDLKLSGAYIRLYRDEATFVELHQEDGERKGKSDLVMLRLCDIRWLRDRLNEILGEVPR